LITLINIKKNGRNKTVNKVSKQNKNNKLNLSNGSNTIEIKSIMNFSEELVRFSSTNMT